MKTSDIKALLRTRYAHPEWALAFEVADATGARGTRYADAVAMNLYPSRGLAIFGFEIKVSKSDFMREIKSPDKSVAVQRYCDFWWIVAPAEAVDESLLPLNWGWIEAKNGSLKARVSAVRLKPEPVSRDFLAALLRRNTAADADEIGKLVYDRVERMRQDDQKRIDAEVSRKTKDAEAAIQKMASLRAKLGREYGYLNDDEIMRAMRLVIDSGVVATYEGVGALPQKLRAQADVVARALEFHNQTSEQSHAA